MFTILIQHLFFIVGFVHLDTEVYRDRPRIKTNNGDLIFVAAYDKNIYLLTKGSKSTIFVGGVNLLNVHKTASANVQYQPPNIDLEDIYRRLERLERDVHVQPFNSTLNTIQTKRKINSLKTKVDTLERTINVIGNDYCKSRPCLHGGTCLNLATEYRCLCPTNWEGKACDEDVNECRIYEGTDLGCQNKAHCKNTPGSYACECSEGWYGQHCTRRNKDCSGGDFEMCGHGTCMPTKSGHGIKCFCDQGWTNNDDGSDACLTDINECEPNQGPHCSVNPKVECINLPGSFRCDQCPPGYDGDGYICYDIDECLTMPNGGCSTNPVVTCHNTVGSRICGPCPAGYFGDGITCTWRGACNVNHGGCHPSSLCIDTSAVGGQMSQCICPPGMEGDGIGLHGCHVSTSNLSSSCETNPCGTHGRCHPLRLDYTCTCYPGYGGAHCDITRDYCSSNPCLNDGRCIIVENSAKGFRCECTSLFSGDLCHIPASTCGGVVHAEKGSIFYPPTNKTYSYNTRCVWIISTDNGKVLNITFSKFDFKDDYDCLNDFLQIHDGRSSASQLIGRFCGNKFPNGGNIISSYNSLYFWFRSDHIAKDNFALQWSSINPVCGGEIEVKTYGQIRSPGSPGKYPLNRDCYWHLSTTLGKRIKLHFFSLEIETNANCYHDFVAIYNGQRSTDPLLGRYCSASYPAPVTSAGSNILIHYHSENNGSGYVFRATFTVKDGIPGCGGMYTKDKGEISSPLYDGNYLNYVICEYKIKTNLDNRIRINFNFFSLQKSSMCTNYYLKVYDGPSENSPIFGSFCGDIYPKSYISSSNQIYIKFKSDYSESAEGFKITYETVCQKTIIGDSGIIKSPGYPFPTNRACEYFMRTVSRKVIQLSFRDFDIPDNNSHNCEYGYIEIRDGVNFNANLLGKYCGDTENTPPMITSTQNYMYLRFTSDANSKTVFYANFTTVDVECGGIYKDNSGTINHPSADQEKYSNDQHCVWILLAPEGMHIKLTWNSFNLQGVATCKDDYVMLIEVDDDINNNLGKYCGRSLPPTTVTTTNQLQIKFQSDDWISSEGFSVSYEFLVGMSHCNENYTANHGFIYSPGWLKKYWHSFDCKWTIVVPVGQQIVLNFTYFKLGNSMPSCDYGDYLDVRNGPTELAPLVDRYCGNLKSTRIVSFSNTLFLRFRSDSLINKGSGFKIEWESTISGCGGTLSSPSGIISSPNYPFDYHENAECFYRIVTNTGSKLRLQFEELDVEMSHNCKKDYVEIFDGRTENSPSLGKYCNKNLEFKIIESTTNYVYIKFRSDFTTSGKGFLLHYSTYCENNITGLHGAIESPGYPDPYPIFYCLWTITVPKGNKINIVFTDFDISYISSDCFRVSLQLKESADTQFGKKLCGKTLPGRITSKSNTLQIKLASTWIVPITSRGFHLEWAQYGCGGHIQKNVGVLRIDKSLTSRGELECQWVIETIQGTGVTVKVVDLYMESAVNCTTDAIEFYNGQNTNTPLLSKVCQRSKDLEPTVTSTTNFMLVRFVKQSYLRDVQFLANFNSFNSSCGGKVQTLSGIITSRNYPKNYDLNVDCLWTLVVPINHRIEFNFMDFDLYSVSNDENDCSDCVIIYDYDGDFNLNSNYTKRFCPNTPISPIISDKNILGVQFLSNNYGTAKGFKANFTVICGATITAKTDGIIENNKWHMTHIIDNCTWIILAPSLDQKIKLTVTHLSIPIDRDGVTNRKCPSSFLRVLDGNDADASLVDEYCGRKTPPMIVSKGSALTLVFGAYNGTAQGLFAVHYSSMSSACGGAVNSEEGNIASPNYPLSYPQHTNCEWILSPSPGNRVYITFEQFDLDWSEYCNKDYLEIRENNGGGNILGLYCSSEVPVNTTIASKLFLKFHSNNVNSGKGFILHYGYLHANDIRDLENGEITSPLYPKYYYGAGQYSWRISVDATKTISITVDTATIYSQGSVCYSSLTFYDGYDEEASVLKELCGILKERVDLKTSTNVAFIKFNLDESNMGSIFHVNWYIADTEIRLLDANAHLNCGFSEIKILSPGQRLTITSPGYPKSYKNNLYCEWVFQNAPGRQINLHFSKLELEETPGCSADSVSIYTSDSLTTWRSVKEDICLSKDVREDFNSTKYMKIVFQTDSSQTREGFEAHVSSACGGFISERSGTIEPRYEDFHFNMRTTQKCDWTVKVRSGRIIKLSFDNFNITNTDNDCSSYVIIRNGDSLESPILKNSIFCGEEHEQRADIKSSSNVVFLTYNIGNFVTMQTFANFKLRFEEYGIECGLTSTLDADHKWEVLNSPNYPSMPTPYSECVWVFTGPLGEVLRLDFLDRFDLDHDCSLEYVEIRDGTSDISKLKGKFCTNTKPGTIKTSGNTMYIKYHTQLAEPRNGFKGNVSIDVCGGTIIASRGEITSPGYPGLQTILYGSVCEWRIIGPQGFTLSIKPEDIELPASTLYCGTKLTIEEIDPFNNTIRVLRTVCVDGLSPIQSLHTEVIQSSSNEVTIKLHLSSLGALTSSETKRGFRFIFNSSIQSCVGYLWTPQGYLTSPGYPSETTVQYCHWEITVPNISRRVRLMILDSNLDKRHIKIIPNGHNSKISNVYESTSNTMIVIISLANQTTRYRFKARFSSDEAATCGGVISEPRDRLTWSSLNQSCTCTWSYRPTSINSTYQTLYIKAKVNGSISNNRYDPALKLRPKMQHLEFFFYRTIRGQGESTAIVPTNQLDIIASKTTGSWFYFHIDLKLNPCGGVFELDEDDMYFFKIPDSYDDILNCAWLFYSPESSRVQIKLEGSFQLDCDKEFIKVKDYDSPLSYIADYCKDKMQDTPLVISNRDMLIRYHSNIKATTSTSLQITIQLVSNYCGGFSPQNYHKGVLESPYFPHHYEPNLECTWEILTSEGQRVSLYFIERFAIEEQTNCSKDAVILYDWKDDLWVQMGRLCGRSFPPVFNSTYNRMKIVFRTDAEIELDGFKAQWESICGGRYYATNKLQFIYIPGSLFYDRKNDTMTCDYEILGGDNRISINFLEFEIAGIYPNCQFDHLTISMKQSSKNDSELKSIYCGNEIPIISKEYNSINLSFKAYSTIHIELSYQINLCGGKIKEPTVINFNKYEYNENCTWIIEAPNDKIVVIHFQYIDLDCINHNVAVFNSNWINQNKRIALLCRSSKRPLRSTDNTMVIQFFSNNRLKDNGFKADIFFSYSSVVGCGGDIDLYHLLPSATQALNSPLINGSTVYENFLDCQWNIKASTDYTIKIKFIQFNIASCEGVNQTAIGYSKCDCDYVQIINGLNPNDLVIGTYCGHKISDGLELSTFRNYMSVRLHTDGEISSTGFKAELSLERNICEQRIYTISHNIQTIKSPGYQTGSIPRGLHCVYHFDAGSENYYRILHLTIKNLDLRPGQPDPNQCNKDKLIIISVPETKNRLDKNFVLNNYGDFSSAKMYFDYVVDYQLPDQYVYCGLKSNIDLYLSGSVSIHVQTSPDLDSMRFKGVELEVSYTGICERNFTELQGRIWSMPIQEPPKNTDDCYILITVPENYTISLFFLYVKNPLWQTEASDGIYLDVYDGNKTSLPKLDRIQEDNDNQKAIFSTGRQVLLHNHYNRYNGSIRHLSFDLNYVATDKGRGCGGKLHSLLGKVTSPLYPVAYRQLRSTCEWELETPFNTHLRLHFSAFDLGSACDSNYVQLVDRSGNTVSTYCEDTPADFTSTDNFVKIVFTTTMNNAGSGWVAEFIAVV